MTLRELKKKDAYGMLEWMKDPECNVHFRFNPESITLESVIDFIEKALVSKNNKHYAVADENDDYLGTISLKNINYKDSTAEYAIALRKSASGKGIGYKATLAILDIAFNELDLNRVYLNVLPDNKRAIALYLKCGFSFEGEFKQHVCIKDKFHNLQWYGITKDEFNKKI